MTDHQYNSIMKMALKIVQKSKDKEEAEAELAEFIKEEKKESDK